MIAMKLISPEFLGIVRHQGKLNFYLCVYVPVIQIKDRRLNHIILHINTLSISTTHTSKTNPIPLISTIQTSWLLMAGSKVAYWWCTIILLSAMPSTIISTVTQPLGSSGCSCKTTGLVGESWLLVNTWLFDLLVINIVLLIHNVV